jgi:hypothetical protein
VGLPNKAQEETEPAQAHVRNRFECPSPNIKRRRTCLAESGTMVARTNQRGDASGSCSYVEKDSGRDEEDSKPSPVTSSALILASYPDEEVVQEEATDDESDDELPSGWTRLKLEPDC